MDGAGESQIRQLVLATALQKRGNKEGLGNEGMGPYRKYTCGHSLDLKALM